MPISAKPTEYTVSSLAVELKMDRRRVGQLIQGLEPHRVEPGKGKNPAIGYYWMRDVLDYLLSGGGSEDGKLNPEQEQAKLAEARRLKLEVETAALRGTLVYREDVEKLLVNHITNCKSRLRAIPHKLAHRVMAATEHSDGLRLLEDGIEEALNELAGIGFEELSGDAEGESEQSLDTAT